MLNDYLRTLKCESTKMAYEKAIKDFLKYTEKELSEIKIQDLLEYKEYLLTRYADASVQLKLRAIDSCFRWLFENYYIESNPTITRANKSVALHKTIEPKRKKTYIPFADMEKLIRQGKNTRDKAIIATYLSTGVRVSELINLTLSDYAKKTPVIITKGGKPRCINFNASAQKYINDYLEDRKDSEYDNLFISNNHTPMTRESLNYMLKSLARRAGLPTDITNHSLRHTVASKVLQESDAATTRDFFKWSSIDMVNRYTHSTDEEVKNISEVLSF
jgi:site-specific recombinase XerD